MGAMDFCPWLSIFSDKARDRNAPVSLLIFYLSDFFFMKLGTSGVKPRRGWERLSS